MVYSKCLILKDLKDFEFKFTIRPSIYNAALYLDIQNKRYFRFIREKKNGQRPITFINRNLKANCLTRKIWTHCDESRNSAAYMNLSIFVFGLLRSHGSSNISARIHPWLSNYRPWAFLVKVNPEKMRFERMQFLLVSLFTV